ncbi:MAG: DUF2760 domain-containing protein [Desulfobacterales bacterium]|nr:DUF2760 domain-containing protein [Desulfobacterales bacterium]
MDLMKKLIKKYSRRSFVRIFFYSTFLLCLMCAGIYLGNDFLLSKITSIAEAKPDDPQIVELFNLATIINDNLLIYVIPIFCGVFYLFILIMWMSLRFAVSKLIKADLSSISQKNLDNAGDESLSQKDRKEQAKRIYLHLFSVLQREGRFMDFLSEDLTLYEDEQIGSAVRNIHENCKKIIDKYLSPKEVINQEEGEEINIMPDFDANSIKLIGNVVGSPPFKGILRHKGWKATKLEPPTLSPSQDSKIIAPAEVEIP